MSTPPTGPTATMRIDALLASGLEDRVYSACQLEIGLRTGVLLTRAEGHTGFDDVDMAAGHPAAIDDHSLFDIASLTKALATALICAQAFDAGTLAPETTLGDVLTEAPDALKRITLAQLLTHKSGLPAWAACFESVAPEEVATTSGRDAVRARVLSSRLEAEPGARERYSDFGYILLDAILERTQGAPLEHLFEERIARPLELQRSTFVPVLRGARPRRDSVATEIVDWRGGLVHGVVHDGNTWAMGGVSGHAGLFSTAADVGCMARTLLAIDAGDTEAADALQISPERLRDAWDRRWLEPNGHHILGWDTPSGERSSAGRAVTREHTVGHLGFTGCSLWMDRTRQAYVVWLTNRVHPSRDEAGLRPLRPALHDEAWGLIDESRG